MRNSLFLIVLFFSIPISSQKTIKGTVYETKGVLEGAAVYFNNTILGTTTNSKGEFSIKVKEGAFELVVSYLGYKKIIYNLNTATYNKPLVFALEEETNTLSEIIVKKTVYDDEWKYNLATFKREFIGKTIFAEDCEILNPEVLHFEYDVKNLILTAVARKPVQIKNKSLGYKITYELEEFILSQKNIIYLGYARYENLKGSKRKQRKWKENRKTAYYGSYLHFYQSILNKTTYKDGFLVHQFKRLPNPERPTELAIKNARELIKLNSSRVNFSINNKPKKTALDSAFAVVRKARLPKFKDYLYKSKVPIDSLVTVKYNTSYLNFDHNIMVVYTKEKEEKGYILREAFSKMRTPTFQTSSVVPNRMPIKIEKNGLLENSLAVTYEGYWSYEKFANSLPLDYIVAE